MVCEANCSSESTKVCYPAHSRTVEGSVAHGQRVGSLKVDVGLAVDSVVVMVELVVGKVVVV